MRQTHVRQAGGQTSGWACCSAAVVVSAAAARTDAQAHGNKNGGRKVKLKGATNGGAWNAGAQALNKRWRLRMHMRVWRTDWHTLNDEPNPNPQNRQNIAPRACCAACVWDWLLLWVLKRREIQVALEAARVALRV